MSVDWTMLLEQLAIPFPRDAVYWRGGATTKDKKRAQALPYAEPRVYEDRLNKLCAGDWEVRFSPWGENRIVCELTIHGVTRASTGEFEEGKSAFAQGTVAEAQAFKRACSKFQLGRYLYDIPLSWVDYDQAKGKLLETPNLPAKFLPNKNPSNKPAPSSTHHSNETPTKPAAKLNKARAEAMEAELDKLDIKDPHGFAASVLGRELNSLTELDDAEALAVWQSARAGQRSAA